MEGRENEWYTRSQPSFAPSFSSPLSLQEYISNPKATHTLLKMLKQTHPDATSSLSLLPLLDGNNNEAADLAPSAAAATAATSQLLAREASSIASSILQSLDMAGFIKDLGYSCTASTDRFREALKESGVGMDERQAALLLCLVATTHKGPVNEMSTEAANELRSSPSSSSSLSSSPAAPDEGGEGGMEGAPTTWNLDVMAGVISTDYPSLDWNRVALELDQPRLFIANQQALSNLITLYERAASVPFPLRVLLRPWTHKVGQLSFIHQAIAAPPSLLTFSSTSGRMQEPFESMPDIRQGPPNKAWLSIDLISTLLSFSETSLWYSARTLFDIPLRHCPEVLICGLACVDQGLGKLRSELLALLAPVYFRPGRSPHAVNVIKRIQQTNPQLLVEAFVERFRSEESAAVVRDTLAVMLLAPSTQQDVLSSSCVEFVVALAAAAADKVRTHPSLKSPFSSLLSSLTSLYSESLHFHLQRSLSPSFPSAILPSHRSNSTSSCSLLKSWPQLWTRRRLRVVPFPLSISMQAKPGLGPQLQARTPRLSCCLWRASCLCLRFWGKTRP